MCHLPPRFAGIFIGADRVVNDAIWSHDASQNNSRLYAEGARMPDLESGDVLVRAVRRQAETMGCEVAAV